MQRPFWFRFLLVLPLTAQGLACDELDDEATCGRSTRLTTPTPGCTSLEPLRLSGTWIETPGDTEHVITSDTWTQTFPGSAPSVFHIDHYENPLSEDDLGTVIAQGDEDNEYNAGKWSRFVFFEEGDAFRYCTAAYDADSASAAESSDDPDVEDLESGCGGFAWSLLGPKR